MTIVSPTFLPKFPAVPSEVLDEVLATVEKAWRDDLPDRFRVAPPVPLHRQRAAVHAYVNGDDFAFAPDPDAPPVEPLQVDVRDDARTLLLAALHAGDRALMAQAAEEVFGGFPRPQYVIRWAFSTVVAVVAEYDTNQTEALS